MSAKDILQNIFSVKNEYGENDCHKTISLAGLKLRFKKYEIKKIPVCKPAKRGFYDSFYNNFRMFNYITDKLCTINEQRWLIENFFYKQHGYFPNLDNPKSFTEKIQWLKLYYRNPEILTLIDKYKVKNYIKETLGEEYVIPLLGAWDNVNDIDFEKLPNEFVLKVNWCDGGSAHVIRNKSELDKEKIKFTLNNEMQPWMSSSYFAHFWAYKQIKPKIIAEKYIEQIDGQVYDYKFFCFNGEPKLIYAAKDNIRGQEFKMAFYDTNWEKQNIKYGKHEIVDFMDKPKNLDKMISFAKLLSKKFPFVRVDFYETKDNLYFGEMTFHPGDGIVPYRPIEWDYKLGSWIKLPDENDPNIINFKTIRGGGN